MRNDDQRFLEACADGKQAVLMARRRMGDLARRVPDPHRAQRIEAELNDAWLRLQFAHLAGDPTHLRSARAACEDLLREVRDAAEGPRPS